MKRVIITAEINDKDAEQLVRRGFNEINFELAKSWWGEIQQCDYTVKGFPLKRITVEIVIDEHETVVF